MDEHRWSVLSEHLREQFCLHHDRARGEQFDPQDLLAAVPIELDWSLSADVAHRINGYELSQQLGLGEVGALANGIADQVAAGGDFPQSLEILWLCLFYEHRRWRHSGAEPRGEDRRYLDSVCRAFAKLLASGNEGPKE